MRNLFKITVVSGILSVLTFPVTSCLAGHFSLAFQRKLPSWENNAAIGCPPEHLGGRACRVWIWDENGIPISNIELRTTWDVLMGTTDTDGRCEIAYSPDVGFDLVCVDTQGSSSDIAYLMTAALEPCRPRHSYEVGFLYKTDISNPGTFDTDLCGIWPEMNGYSEETPYTKSLAYSGVDCTDYWSDRSYWGNWQNPPSYFGQTFIATGDRVVAARVQGTIGANDLLDWKLRIVTFPGLVPVGPVTSVPVRFPFGWEAFWGVDDCPVVPGQTYMLQVWRDGDGMNIYHVTADVYPDGQYYEGTTPFPQFDLNGHICCMTYGGEKTIDFTGDGRIDFRDFCKLAQHWLGYEPSVDVAPPPGGDGIVDFNDLRMLTEKWMTATTIPPLPQPASGPNPPDGATGVSLTLDLRWTAGLGATSHDVYIGWSDPPPFRCNQTGTRFQGGTLAPGITYYWRIDEVNLWGKTEGTVWRFTTTTLPPD